MSHMNGKYRESLSRLEKILLSPSQKKEHLVETLVSHLSWELNVGRVGLWKRSSERGGLICLSLFNSKNKTFSHGTFLSQSLYPSYFSAMEKNEIMPIESTFDDERTKEFIDDYLQPFGIYSMLDVPVVVEGEVLGVLCFEEVGKKRIWDDEEKELALSASKLCATYFFEEERRIKEELRKTQFYSVGRLASGITHEINNPLTICFGFLGVLEESLAEKDLFQGEIKAQIGSLHHALERIRCVVKELRSYLYTDYEKQEAVCLSELIHATLLLFKGVFDKEHIQVSLKFPSEEIHLLTNKSLLQQALINTFFMVRESIVNTKRKKGLLEISLGKTNTGVLCLSFRDDGVQRETSEMMEGTLDLLKRLNAKSTFESNSKDGGNFFSLFFSTHESSFKEDVTTSRLEKIYPKSMPHILIVDDEREILELLTGYFKKWNFLVTTATNGQEALEIVKSNDDIDLIISDLKMPVMDGKEFLHHAIQEGYSGKFLVISGYFHDLEIKQIEEMSMKADDVIKKPFDKVDLVKSLKRLGFEIEE